MAEPTAGGTLVHDADVRDELTDSAERRQRERRGGDRRGDTHASGAGALLELTRARLLEFAREPELVFWSFVFPVLLAAGLAIAFRERPPAQLRVGVRDGAAASAATARAIAADSTLVPQLLGDSAAAAALRGGTIAMLVVPQPDGAVAYHWDPNRDDARAARLLVDGALQRAGGRRDVQVVREVTAAPRGSRYIDFFLPGLLGLNLMSGGMWGLGFSIVTARKQRLLKRFAATPMPRAAYLLSYLLSRLVFVVLEVGVVLAFGVLVLDVPVRGSWWLVAALCLVGALAFNALGLLVAARVRTVEGASGLMNLVQVPMWVLSGVFFASTNFPAMAQPLIRALPLTALNDALRAVMLQGTGVGGVMMELAILGAWTVVPFVVALRIFRWQ
ncbi:MAG: ABC transporter permease [Gemmatimonadaceae bacterium]|nr:ABC transporter permease [Gemmatimonadaceae bacterium]